VTDKLPVVLQWTSLEIYIAWVTVLLIIYCHATLVRQLKFCSENFSRLQIVTIFVNYLRWTWQTVLRDLVEPNWSYSVPTYFTVHLYLYPYQLLQLSWFVHWQRISMMSHGRRPSGEPKAVGRLDTDCAPHKTFNLNHHLSSYPNIQYPIFNDHYNYYFNLSTQRNFIAR
jgi:hypothetical protein